MRYPSVKTSMTHRGVWLSGCPAILVGVCPSTELFTHLFGRPSVAMSACPSGCASIRPSWHTLIPLGGHGPPHCHRHPCPQTIFTWCGAQCNVLERSRAQELAAAIRDGQRGSKVRLEMVMDGEEPPEMLQVLGPKPTLTEGSPEEDAAADRDAGTAVLYKARREGCVGLGMARGPPRSGLVAQQWVRLPKALSNPAWGTQGFPVGTSGMRGRGTKGQAGSQTW